MNSSGRLCLESFPTLFKALTTDTVTSMSDLQKLSLSTEPFAQVGNGPSISSASPISFDDLDLSGFVCLDASLGKKESQPVDVMSSTLWGSVPRSARNMVNTRYSPKETKNFDSTLHVKDQTSVSPCAMPGTSKTVYYQVKETPVTVGTEVSLCPETFKAKAAEKPQVSYQENPSENGFKDVIDFALSSSEAIDFDPLELHDAFLNFFAKGEVSNELDNYFNKVLANEDFSLSKKVTKLSERSRMSSEEDAIVTELMNDAKQSANVIHRLTERRRRNNEASRRSRAANKERFRMLAVSVEQLNVEKRQLLIWLRDIQLSVQNAKRLLLHGPRRPKSISSFVP